MGDSSNETLALKMSGLNRIQEPSQGVNCSYGTYGVFVVVVLFQFLNWIIRSIGPPKSLRDDEWKWRNLLISYLHALVCVSWSIGSIIENPQMFLDVQYYRSYTLLFLLTFTTGYFLYDFIDLALNGKMISMWEVQLHHVAVGGMFYYNLVNCEWQAFNVIALLVEVNSFFLHQRKLLQMVGTPFTSPLYRLTIFLNIFTFVVFRGIPFAAILWAMTQWWHRVTLVYFVSLGAAMFVMVVMNPILFMRLLRTDYLRGRGKVGSKAAAVNGNNNHLLHNSGSQRLKSS